MKTLASLSFSIAAGPRLEILTELVCKQYYRERQELSGFAIPPGGTTATSIYHNATEYSSTAFGRCTGDPQVQAEVARVNASMWNAVHTPSLAN